MLAERTWARVRVRVSVRARARARVGFGVRSSRRGPRFGLGLRLGLGRDDRGGRTVTHATSIRREI